MAITTRCSSSSRRVDALRGYGGQRNEHFAVSRYKASYASLTRVMIRNLRVVRREPTSDIEIHARDILKTRDRVSHIGE
jgi:hypothetical protein